MNTKLLAVPVILMILCVPVFAGGDFDDFKGTEGVSKGNNSKTYVFATDATWPPMEFVDEEGNIAGFDMELLDAIAQASGFQYKIKNTSWDGIFSGLAKGAYDAVISSVTITEGRLATMDFSMPYVNAGQILVVPIDYTGGEKLQNFGGKRVGVQRGTTGDFAVEAVPSVDRRAYIDVELAIEDMIIGNLEAVVCDTVTAISYVTAYEVFKGKLKVLGEPFTEEYFGIAVQKGNTELLALINDGLAAVVADGTQAQLTKKWLR